MVSNKLKILFLSLLLAGTSYSQTWFELGLKGGPAATFLVNSNVLDDAQFNHKVVPTYFAGFKVGVNFGEEHGVALDLSTTAIRQKYSNDYELSSFDERLIKAQTIDIGLLYHRTKSSGYFEIGPQLSLVQSAYQIDDGSGEVDISNDVNGNYFGGTLGFGAYLLGNDVISLMTGLRFSYGVAFSPETYDATNNATITEPSYETPKSTHVATAMLCFELNYSLGYLVRSSCGRRSSFLSF